MEDAGGYTQYLERIPLFKGWSEAEVADFLKRGRTREVEAGKTIFERRVRGDTLYIIFSGIVEITAGEVLLAQCNIGDTFGEISAIDHCQHTATAVAGSTLLLFEMKSAALSEVLKQPYAVRFLLNIVHQLGAHVANANAHVEAMESKLERIERTRTPALRE